MNEVGMPPASGQEDPLAYGEDKQVYDLYVRFNWTCGDGVCDHYKDWPSGIDLPNSEDCASCPADCGCTGYETCGGGGTPGACGCTPLTSCPSDYQCGSIPDGCGGTVDCSGGRSCEDIVGKKFWACVPEAHMCCKHGRCTDEDEQ